MIRALCRIQATKGGPASLGLVDEKSARLIPGVDLSGLIANVTDLTALRAALAELAADGESIPLALLQQGNGTGWPRLISPVDHQECWGAGCTYRIDEQALDQIKAERPLYASAYAARRPMLFYKGSARSVAGPGDPIACRVGAERTIPEAELTLLLAPSGSILAFALGNDVTALDLEQNNPLYQPQAKVFDGGAALGPWWTLADTAGPGATTPFSCVVRRSGATVLEQNIDPARLVRRPEDLANWLFEAASFPKGAVLMTGGGAAVPTGFALKGGDEVIITHPVLGELRNLVLPHQRAPVWPAAGREDQS
jgi:2-dehydro-3-deoxy-D-arabinonate dehydratase